MLISPPFLPPRPNTVTEDAWLDAAMPDDPQGHGKYPLSFHLGWHGGVHLQAPQGNNGQHLSVRAIADGIVVYVRQPEAPNDDPQHALNYGDADGNPVWTSNGCVVIRHTTEIGADADGHAAPVTFFSVYMHLHAVLPTVRQGRAIYRKDEIGDAGYIYGQPNLLHFEIFCDDANLQRLIGRADGDLPMAQNGREDAVYGNMHFYLPAGTPIYGRRPLPHLSVASDLPAHPAHAHPAHAPAPAPQALTPVHTTTQDLYIGMRYEHGHCAMTTRRQGAGGDYEDVGEALVEADVEYNLYAEANRIVTACRNAHAPQVPCASAVYELLRFGRAIGPDALTPPDTPHWRQIRYDGGQGWVNLNAPNVRQCSDADFPHWMGWKLVDDSADQDSRCDSTAIRGWLDSNGDGRVTPQEATARLGDAAVQKKLARVIAKFATEWDAASIDTRWGWLKTSTPENPEPLAEDDFSRLKAHCAALCFWQQANLGIPASHWHFQPQEFIRQFRGCGWLALDEMRQLMPRVCPAEGAISWSEAGQRFNSQTNLKSLDLNLVFRRHGFNTAARQTAFLAQIYIETGRLKFLVESGAGHPNPHIPMAQYYAAFYGRGVMQLTWASNYELYGKFRNFPNHVGPYSDQRITATSVHHWAAPTAGANGHLHSDTRQWAPRYDPALIATSSFNAYDSGAFFWITKSFLGQKNIHRLADQGITAETVGKMSVLVNGGGNGYDERLKYAAFIDRYRSDSVDTDQAGVIRAIRQIIHNVNGHIAWGNSGQQYNLNVNYTAQRG